MELKTHKYTTFRKLWAEFGDAVKFQMRHKGMPGWTPPNTGQNCDWDNKSILKVRIAPRCEYALYFISKWCNEHALNMYKIWVEGNELWYYNPRKNLTLKKMSSSRSSADPFNFFLELFQDGYVFKQKEKVKQVAVVRQITCDEPIRVWLDTNCYQKALYTDEKKISDFIIYYKNEDDLTEDEKKHTLEEIMKPLYERLV